MGTLVLLGYYVPTGVLLVRDPLVREIMADVMHRATRATVSLTADVACACLSAMVIATGRARRAMRRLYLAYRPERDEPWTMLPDDT